MKNATSTDRHAGKTAAWKAAKRDYRESGGRNWKAAKKIIKRMRRNERRLMNALTDNAMLTV